MIEEIRKAAVSAIITIFETMFFILLEPVAQAFPQTGEAVKFPTGPGESSQPSFNRFLKSEIHFEGFYSGKLCLLLPYGLSEMMTMNFMGFEDEVNESQLFDMSGELANMICGNLFSILDKTSFYNLGSPVTEAITFDPGREPLSPADITLNFLAEGQPVTVQLRLTSGFGSQ